MGATGSGGCAGTSRRLGGQRAGDGRAALLPDHPGVSTRPHADVVSEPFLRRQPRHAAALRPVGRGPLRPPRPCSDPSPMPRELNLQDAFRCAVEALHAHPHFASRQTQLSHPVERTIHTAPQAIMGGGCSRDFGSIVGLWHPRPLEKRRLSHLVVYSAVRRFAARIATARIAFETDSGVVWLLRALESGRLGERGTGI